jgi:hypothetical protein
VFFPDLIESAKLQPGAPFRLCPRETSLGVAINQALEVVTQFVVQVAFNVSA